MKLTVCKKCNCEVTNVGFALHLISKHTMSTQAYYDEYEKKENEGICKTCGRPTKFKSIAKGYTEFCSGSCRSKFVNSSKRHSRTCSHCGIEIYGNTPNALGMAFNAHIRGHGFEPKEYYDKYVRKENEGICRQCGKETTFHTISVGYAVYCSKECSCLANQQNNRKQYEAVQEIREERQMEEYRQMDATERFQNELKENAAQYDKEKKILYHSFETSPIYFQKFDTEVSWG